MSAASVTAHHSDLHLLPPTTDLARVEDRAQHPGAPRRTAEVTDLDLVRAERFHLAQESRSAARSVALAELLERRPELVGIYAPADFAVAGVRSLA